jgi:O-antigen/teichoic acid export membrane protein
MSRFKRFASSLLSGYALILANIFYTLASVPLALHYLSKEQFGLWALVMQVCNFNQIMIDLGMSGALARVLIDHKDDQSTTAYGSVIQTGFLILLVQGVLMAVIGGAISYWLPQWMEVPPVYWRDFRLLVIGQCGLLAFGFALRISTFILHAHQRFDIANYAQLGGFAVGLVTLWIGFEAGLGIFSLLVSAAAPTLFVSLACFWGAHRLKLFPGRGRWGRPDRKTFRELFFYGTDLFLVSIGLQLITASQTLVITRTLGLEATAIWSIASKLFILSQQLVYRLLDFSTAAFSEMMVRGEKARLLARFRDLIIFSGSISATIAVTMALCNRAFLKIWTDDRISWPIENDILMACSLVVYASTRCHITLAGITKKVGAMKYIYFAEGLCFVGLGLLAAPRLGLSGVILSGILTNLCFSGLYGVRRSAKYFNLKVREIFLNWLCLPARVGLVTGIAAVAVWYPTRNLAPLAQLLVCGSLMGIIGTLCFWRLGLPAGMRQEGLERLSRLRARFVGGA